MCERLWAIMSPFEYRVVVEEERVSRGILACWVLALVPGLPMWGDTTIERAWRGRAHCTCYFPLDNVRTILQFFFTVKPLISEAVGPVDLSDHVHSANLSHHLYLVDHGAPVSNTRSQPLHIKVSLPSV